MKTELLPADFPHKNLSDSNPLFRRAFYNLSTRHKVAYCLACGMSIASAAKMADGCPKFERIYTRVLECIESRFSSAWQDVVWERSGSPARFYAFLNRNRKRFGFEPLRNVSA